MLDVVRGHVGRPAQPVGGAEVGDAEPQREHPVAVLVDGAGDAVQGLGAGLAGAAARATPGPAWRTAAGRSRRLGGGERLQEGDAALLGELGQHESGQQPRRRRRAGATRSVICSGVRTRMKSSGRSASGPARRGRRTAGPGSPRRPATSASSMESSRHSTMETTPRAGLLDDVVGEPRAGWPGCRGWRRGRRRACRAGESAVNSPGSRWKSSLPHLRRRGARNDACDSPVAVVWTGGQMPDVWPIIVRASPCRTFPPGVKIR